jgi:hypothetical protein
MAMVIQAQALPVQDPRKLRLRGEQIVTNLPIKEPDRPEKARITVAEGAREAPVAEQTKSRTGVIRQRKECCLVSVVILLISTLQAETLTLSADFVNKNKNRATVAIQFELDAHLRSPHRIGSSGDDGDVHMAGRAPEIQLPMVAEIMNAGLREQLASVDLMNQTALGQIVAVTGAWRIWFEHPSPGDQTQGDAVDLPADSNPNHVFEIHPITKFGTNDIANTSLVPIDKPSAPHDVPEDYQAYPASKAFGAYEKLQATINVSATSISITAKQAGYNYTEFLLDPVGKPLTGDDGTFVLANVYDVSDPETPVTDAPRRMVFISNTQPEAELRKLIRGQMLHVLGIPRINLAEVAAVSGSDPVDIALPYEIIVVAVFSENQTNSSAPEQPHRLRSSAPAKR